MVELGKPVPDPDREPRPLRDPDGGIRLTDDEVDSSSGLSRPLRFAVEMAATSPLAPWFSKNPLGVGPDQDSGSAGSVYFEPASATTCVGPFRSNVDEGSDTVGQDPQWNPELKPRLAFQTPCAVQF